MTEPLTDAKVAEIEARLPTPWVWSDYSLKHATRRLIDSLKAARAEAEDWQVAAGHLEVERDTLRLDITTLRRERDAMREAARKAERWMSQYTPALCSDTLESLRGALALVDPAQAEPKSEKPTPFKEGIK